MPFKLKPHRLPESSPPPNLLCLKQSSFPQHILTELIPDSQMGKQSKTVPSPFIYAAIRRSESSKTSGVESYQHKEVQGK